MSRKPRKSSRTARFEGNRESPQVARGHSLALLALSALGLVLSAYLTFVHHRVRAEPGWQSACAISSAFDCDAVLLSPYSTFAGAPLAILGAWFYVLTGAIAAIGVRRSLHCLPRSPAMCLFLASALAASLSVALAVTSGVAIHAFCLFCSGLYVVNLAMLILSWRALRRTDESLAAAWRAERRHWKRSPGRAFGTSAGAVASLLAVLFVYSKSDSAVTSVICTAVAEAARQRSNEPVSLTMYTDFQCPPCRALDASLRPIRDRLRITHRHYPLDRACNPMPQRTAHAGACLQARAAICAGRAGRYDDFSDRLFDGGPSDAEGLVELASLLGLDRENFGECLRSDESSRELQASIDAAIADEVRATPTVFVSGQRHVGRLSESELRCLGSDFTKLRTGRTAGSQLSH